MISIAMATYNGANYIREQIDSILNQTIQDFELVICDDCSTDETLSILKEYVQKDSRIHLYKNDVNLGFKKNFEKAISYCTGELIALCDQDDIWYDSHLEVLLNHLGDKTQIVCGDATLIDGKGNDLQMTLSYLDGMDYVPTDDLDKARHILLHKNTFQGASMLIKKELVNKAIPIPKDVVYHDIWFALFACFEGGLNYTKEPVLKYRRHECEITAGKKRYSRYRMILAEMIVSGFLSDRLKLVEELQDRLHDLSKEQKFFLEEVKSILLRRDTLWGRISNLPYLLKHFNNIYTER